MSQARLLRCMMVKVSRLALPAGLTELFYVRFAR